LIDQGKVVYEGGIGVKEHSAIVMATFMRLPAICRRIIATDTGVLVLSALALVALHGRR